MTESMWTEAIQSWNIQLSIMFLYRMGNCICKTINTDETTNCWHTLSTHTCQIIIIVLVSRYKSSWEYYNYYHDYFHKCWILTSVRLWDRSALDSNYNHTYTYQHIYAHSTHIYACNDVCLYAKAHITCQNEYNLVRASQQTIQII